MWVRFHEALVEGRWVARLVELGGREEDELHPRPRAVDQETSPLHGVQPVEVRGDDRHVPVTVPEGVTSGPGAEEHQSLQVDSPLQAVPEVVE